MIDDDLCQFTISSLGSFLPVDHHIRISTCFALPTFPEICLWVTLDQHLHISYVTDVKYAIGCRWLLTVCMVHYCMKEYDVFVRFKIVVWGEQSCVIYDCCY